MLIINIVSFGTFAHIDYLSSYLVAVTRLSRIVLWNVAHVWQRTQQPVELQAKNQ